MPKRRRKSILSKQNWISIIITSAVLAFMILMTLADSFNLKHIPTWDKVYFNLGLTDSLPETPLKNGTIEVDVIDVGQGDSILIRTDGKTALIDTGEKTEGETVSRYLKSNGISRIDYLVATHPHSDHMGSMSYIVDTFDIGEVIMPPIPDDIMPTARFFTDALKSIKNKGLKITTAKAGQRLELGSNAVLTVLGPVQQFDSLNNISVVCRLSLGKTSFLFTGDMEAEAETALLKSGAKLSSTVLKLGHHGSKTSTTQKFLDEVNPSYAVISVGADNSYSHPHQETLKKLKTKKIPVYRTDESGTVTFVSDGESIKASTEK
ncbi:MAG TPA: hypothetical protein DCP97_01615 [Ruminococcaceae bacterium]|nr:hypothetical protein [Oscillospiraceae bacterium]